MSEQENPIRELLEQIKGQGLDPEFERSSSFIFQNKLVEEVIAVFDAGKIWEITKGNPDGTKLGGDNFDGSKWEIHRV